MTRSYCSEAVPTTR